MYQCNCNANNNAPLSYEPWDVRLSPTPGQIGGAMMPTTFTQWPSSPWQTGGGMIPPFGTQIPSSPWQTGGGTIPPPFGTQMPSSPWQTGGVQQIPTQSGTPGTSTSSGVSGPPPSQPSATAIEQYNYFKNNPAVAIEEDKAKPKHYTAGCGGAYTIVVTQNPFAPGGFEVLLMLVHSTDMVHGISRGWLYPTYAPFEIPTAKIIYYTCAF